jgi:hypothetical protein
VREHYLTALLPASAGEPVLRAHVSHSIVWRGSAARLRGSNAAFGRTSLIKRGRENATPCAPNLCFGPARLASVATAGAR